MDGPLERLEGTSQRRNALGVAHHPETMLVALCEAISARKSHRGAWGMAEIITVLFIAAFFFALGYMIGKGR